MKIAIAGLGRMGMQIAASLSRDGHEVIVQNRSADKVDYAVQAYGVTAAYTAQDLVQAFADEQMVVWMMLPADVFDKELNEWLSLLKRGDIMIDGGNSNFRDTQRHYKQAEEHGIELIDVGTSGGVHGYDNGFSMMVAGHPDAISTLKPALDTLSKPHGSWYNFGPSGSGHYVKMVHNAIEYGMMESLAEGYRMLREGPYGGIDLSAAGSVWQHGSIIESRLNELTRQALEENPTLGGIDGVVAESGEARWTLETAKELHIPLPAIDASFEVRLASQKGETHFATKLLAAMRNKFGGHEINPGSKS